MFTSQLCSFLGVLTNIGYIILAIAVLLLMIMVHEFGHYIAGKILHFKINEFSIGFGKAIFSKKMKNGEIFSVRIVPLGGYCAFEGEDEDGNENPDAFNNQAGWKRLIVLFMGAFFNFLGAVLISVFVLMGTGDGVVKVENVYATEYNQQIEIGDQIKGVNGVSNSMLFNVKYRIQECGDSTYTLNIIRDGKAMDIEVKNGEYTANGETHTGLGISMSQVTYNFGQALLLAFPFCGRIAWDCLVILGMLFTGQLGITSVGGPITTISTIATVSQTSFQSFLMLFPLLGVNLAVFNLLPFPALDGARMVFVLIEMIRRKPINRKVEGYIHSAGLIILMAFVVIVDLLHFIL